MTPTNSANSIGTESQARAPSIGRELWAEKGYLREAVIAGVLANLMALMLPLFVMTSYDRVLPNAAFSSLWGLAVGILIAALVDIFARSARSKLLEHLGRRIDLRLSSRLLQRMLRVPYVNRPKQLGEISAGFRELESLRGLLSNTTLTVLVDLPFAILFIAIIAFMAPALAFPGMVALPVLLLIALLAGRMGISEGAAAGIADIEQQVALQASTAYTNLWRAGTQYEIAQQARQAHETLVDQIGRRVETGVSGEAELIQVQGRLSLSQSNESAALNALQDARANYRRVVGKLPDFEVAKTMLDWDRPPFLDMAVQNAFRDHPIIKVAEADIQEATALGQSAQGSQLPRITLELGANLNRDLDGTPGTSKDRFAMLRMNWDLYNGGSNMAAERAAGFRLSEAEHLLNDAQREVVELAHQAWNAYMTTKQQLVYLDMFVESAVNTREAYAQQFTINRRTLQEVLDSEVEVFDARSARVEAEADHVIADLQLAASQGQLLQVMQQIN